MQSMYFLRSLSSDTLTSWTIENVLKYGMNIGVFRTCRMVNFTFKGKKNKNNDRKKKSGIITIWSNNNDSNDRNDKGIA